MIKYLIPLLLLISCSNLPKTTPKSFSFKKIATLPDAIHESSGLITLDGKLITHNDSGSMPVLYQLDTTGTITDYVKYKYLFNHDWEAITQSNKAIHIADIGNNDGDRRDLKIYNIHKNSLWLNGVDLDISNISYVAQENFDKKPLKNSFDAEATVVIDEIMYLFSKDWINFSTSIYKLPIYSDKALEHHQIINIKGLATDVTYNNKSRVLLCGYDQSLQPFIVELKFENKEFTLVKKIDLPINDGAQIEAITYYGDDKEGNEIYYLTSETVNIKLGDDEIKSTGELYKLIWKQ